MWEALSSGSWVTVARVRAISTMALTATVVALLLLLATAHGTVDAMGRPIGTDFSNVWAAGWMANHGQAAAAWNWAAHHAVQQAIHHDPAIAFYGWHYPPPFLMLASLLARMPYIMALLLWQAVTLGLALAVVRSIVPGRDALLAAIGAPVVLICLGHGQNAFLTGALLGGGMLLLDRKPWIAGLLLGCLVYKPQFAVLIPVVLIAAGNWRAFLSAACAVLTLCALTLMLWGWPVWGAFIDSLTITRVIVIEQGNTGWEKIESAFSAIRMWGGSVPLAYAVQSVVTGTAILTAAVVARRGSMANRAAATLAAALLSTPYVLDYDFVVLGVAVAFVVADIRARGALRWEASLLAFAWIVPLFGRQATALTLIPLELIAAITILMLAARRAIVMDGALPVRPWPWRQPHAVSAR
jgi:hypothetical protein